MVVVNDADAAGLAETRYGAARGQDGLVVLTTLGTGIGTALVYDGVLVPDSELGHLEIDGKDAETEAANSARERRDLSWKEWAKVLTRYYQTLERLISPDLFVVGGGVSKHADKYLPLLDIDTRSWPPPCEHRRDRRRRGPRRGGSAPHRLSARRLPGSGPMVSTYAERTLRAARIQPRRAARAACIVRTREPRQHRRVAVVVEHLK